MKLKITILVCMAGLISLSFSDGAQAQDPIPPLPADLLFTASLTAGQGDYPRDVIVRVDAETLEVTPFFVDEEAFEIAPISWSPQGDLLAIYRVMPPIDSARTLFPRQLCIMDRGGMLQRCLDNGPPMHYAGGFPDDWMHYFPVSWESDGKTIYFETEYPNDDNFSGYERRIVEASVITGETLRVVYSYPESYPVTISPNLSHIAVGFKREFLGEGNPTFLRDLTAGIQIALADVAPDHTEMNWTCLPFSPGGQFIAALVAYNVSEYAPNLEPPDDHRNGWGSLLLLLDSQGSVRHIVGEPEGSPAVIWDQECPGWQSDERAIVFLAFGVDESRIMRYTLADQQTTTLAEMGFAPGQERHVHSPLIPSPDGSHVALTISEESYGGDRLVAVLYPDGEIYRIPSPYRFGLYPLWVPPLETE